MGTFSIWHWLIVLVVVVLVFGSKKLVNAGPDLGKAIRGFRESMRDGDKSNSAEPAAKSDALESRQPSSNGAPASSIESAAEKTASS